MFTRPSLAGTTYENSTTLAPAPVPSSTQTTTTTTASLHTLVFRIVSTVPSASADFKAAFPGLRESILKYVYTRTSLSSGDVERVAASDDALQTIRRHRRAGTETIIAFAVILKKHVRAVDAQAAASDINAHIQSKSGIVLFKVSPLTFIGTSVAQDTIAISAVLLLPQPAAASTSRAATASIASTTAATQKDEARLFLIIAVSACGAIILCLVVTIAVVKAKQAQQKMASKLEGAGTDTSKHAHYYPPQSLGQHQQQHQNAVSKPAFRDGGGRGGSVIGRPLPLPPNAISTHFNTNVTSDDAWASVIGGECKAAEVPFSTHESTAVCCASLCCGCSLNETPALCHALGEKLWLRARLFSFCCRKPCANVLHRANSFPAHSLVLLVFRR